MSRFDSILLGDNAFYGIDHLSHERARERAKTVQTIDNAVKVIKYSYELGINGMVVATRPQLKDWVQKLQSTTDLVDKLDFYPVMPYARGLQSKISQGGLVNVMKEIMKTGGIGSEIKILVKGGMGVMKKDLNSLFKVFIDTEMLKLKMIRPKIIYMHPVLVDVSLALDMKNIFQVFSDHLNDKYKIKAGLCTKNFSVLVEKLDSWDMKTSSIMTSFNAAGFLMNPSKEACENTLSKYDGHVLAMNIFAGGFTGLDAVEKYILSQPKIRNIVVGLSSIEHAKETFGRFINAE